MNFAKTLLNCRHQTGLSLRDAGEEADIDYKTIHRWEQGRSLPKMSTLIRYCNWLESKGVDVDKYNLIKLASGDASDANPRVPTAS